MIIYQGFSQIKCFRYKLRKIYEFCFSLRTYQLNKFVQAGISNINRFNILHTNVIICGTLYDEMVFVLNIRVTKNTLSLVSLDSSSPIPASFYSQWMRRKS